MTHIYIVDAFTSAAFRGNPAAVCLLETPAEEGWMQLVAREMNLSETAFLAPTESPERWRLRWFTPAVEVDLCGHATLAAAHVLREQRGVSHVRYETRSGVLESRHDRSWIELDFPALPPAASEAPAGLLEALGIAPPRYVGRSRYDVLVEVGSEDEVRNLRPDLRAIPGGTRGVIVTAAGSPPYDFVSRFFAPAVGVDEDPVTGSAHCVLGPYWKAKLRRPSLRAHQASARGGEIGVEVRGDRVVLRGQAVTVVRGELTDRACP